MTSPTYNGPEEFDGDFEDEFGDEFEDTFVNDVVEELQEDLEAMTNYAASADASLFTAAMIIADQQAQLSDMSFEMLIMGVQTAIMKDLLKAAGTYISQAEAEKAEAAELAERLERTLSQPGLTDWALKRYLIDFQIDGVSTRAEVELASRHLRTDTRFDRYGEEERTDAVSTADAQVTINLPFVGAVTVPGKVTHTVTSYSGHSSRHSVTNKLVFELPIGDVTRQVTITSSGTYYNDGDGYVWNSEAVVDHQECEWCQGDHGRDKEVPVIVS